MHAIRVKRVLIQFRQMLDPGIVRASFKTSHFSCVSFNLSHQLVKLLLVFNLL